ncbi:hypothetical protein NQ318_010461 [Aromia moschata]|uniref:Uncharacterized protein n=1 Tax=Aromia moschata TaxID=1265417 RepID=A0AAV8YBN8_9CUCU|nr:hypothetical protein NQ318_010461 [Aromia moschata]
MTEQLTRLLTLRKTFLARVEADPQLSTRRIGAAMEISKDVVHRTLKEELLHPYHKTPVQDLLSRIPDRLNRPNGLQVISKKTISEVELWRLVAAKRSNMVYRITIQNLFSDLIYHNSVTYLRELLELNGLDDKIIKEYLSLLVFCLKLCKLGVFGVANHDPDVRISNFGIFSLSTPKVPVPTPGTLICLL